MAQSDALRMPERAEEAEVTKAPLTKMSMSVWPGRTDTRSLVSALMLSLCMIVLQFPSERIDTLLNGGAFPLFGRVVAFTMIGLSSMMYGFAGGAIVAWINPFIATAGGSSPIAPFFFVPNTLIAVAACIVGSRTRHLISPKGVLAFTALATVMVVASYVPLHAFYLRLPVERMVSLYAVQSAVSLTVPAILVYALLKVVRSAGFVRP